jgi:ribosomal protein L7/L12
MICFLQSPDKKGLDPDSLQATQARASVDRVHAHILNAMREAQGKASAAPVAFTADELQKLWDMKQAGILTEDEFAQQKARLLGQLGQSKGTSAPFATLPQPATYSVVLVDPGRDKIQVIKAIRGITPHLGLREAKDLVDGTPAVLATGVSSGDAERIRQTLVITGATIDLKPDVH